MNALRLGLDIGTTAIKVAAYDVQGNLVAQAAAPSQTLAGPEGRAEQDMGAIWQAVCTTLRKLMADLGDAPIAALGVCGQGDGLWLLDDALQPVGPARLWNDTRAAQDLDALTEQGAIKAVGLACHTALWPGTSGMLWRWVTQHAPDEAARASYAITCPDWIGACLTGQVATDFSNASIPFLDLSSRSYSDAALTALGCTDLRPRLAQPRAADSLLGSLSATAAAATGLPEGVPVSVPTLDLAAMIVGLGMQHAGETMFIMGTTAVVNILTDHVTPTPCPVGASALHPCAETIIRILAPSTGTSAFDWFAGLHPLSLGGAEPAEIAAKLNALVRDVPPGANGVTFLPYLNGERAPFVAPQISAAFHGLRSTTSKADMGRAVMEGTALSLRHCLSAENHQPTGPVRLTGGGARNPVWAQIIADVTGTAVDITAISDHGLWGAACLGAAAAGLGRAIDLAQRKEQTERFSPDPRATRAYDTIFERYTALSAAARAFNPPRNEAQA